ncbi:MAG: indolepyruvate ferredoxin oxidoreductase family protein [Gammaproteobacteria bacterium]|nr:indolepyruvate ferredoxin oxidoreductase family protein [Gammaproteobacteria bacterium]
MGASHSLDDKYTATEGSVFLTGTQALVRLPLVQMRRDRANGLNTAAFISGYRGSPLGGYDQQLGRAQAHLRAHQVTFQPGVNEDLAATAIWGTQQVPLSEQATHDGVLGLWYGKGPGVDRSGDVFKHGNAAGTSEHGGVLCLAGDDHTAKSSTLPHQSDHAFMAAVIPMLYPSSVHEFIEVGLLGIAMSRYSGAWVGMKVIADTVETSAVIDLSGEQREFILPTDHELPDGGLNLRWPDPPLVQDDRLQEHKAYAALAFARANQVDVMAMGNEQARFGIMASGKAFEDVRQALIELGISEQVAKDIGLRVYKVRMPWPLEPSGVRQFSEGLEEVLIIEERREMIEFQIKQQLFNWRADVRPRIVGKFDENDSPFLPLSMALSISRVARAIADRLLRFELPEELRTQIESRLNYLQRRADERASHQAPVERQPWFCSGCPHNTSTKVPDGSKALAGIGCHYMVQWMDRDTDTFTQMGGEGLPWTALSHYTKDQHRFVNLGDGTYFHSGILAIRAAVASGVNVTYKVLYNDAVAMTGGQTLDGDLSPQQVTHQLHAEGVRPIYLVSDDPDQYSPEELAPGVQVAHRDELLSIMKTVRDLKGCNGIVYEQTCAAEKRRRRKRGLLEDPTRRVFIHPGVCEGCGDCSVQSNCVSIEPLETEFGRKRKVNQSSCNKDYSCVNGFCPSFVSVDGAVVKKSAARQQTGEPLAPVAEPAIPAMSEEPVNVAITGVGGTGVLTIGALIGTAAHLDGHASMVLDMAGLAQKGGAVLSYVRLASKPEHVTSPNIVAGGADVVIAADDVVAASRDGIVLMDPARTVAVVNTTSQPVAAFVGNRDFDFKADAVLDTIGAAVKGREHFHAFTPIAEQFVGDAIATNIMMLGYAWQCGLLPLTLGALQQAIELNGVAVSANLKAFEWGRRLAESPKDVLSKVQPPPLVENTLDSMTLEEVIEHRALHLTNYQNDKLAQRYRALIDRVIEKCHGLGLDNQLARTVAVQYAKLLSYKDEYEVARLYASADFQKALDAQFEGEYTLSFHLAPPLLSGKNDAGRPKKRTFGASVRPLFRWLQKGKVWRGTPLDIFGYSAERRKERQLIVQYEQDIADILDTLEPSKINQAIAIANVPERIRGFGPVKLQAIEKAQVERLSLLKRYAAPAIHDLTQAA